MVARQVSGLSQASFENVGIDFKRFTKKYRGQRLEGRRVGVPTHYMELVTYLRQRPTDQFTGLERYVYDKFMANDPSFFPLVTSPQEEDDYLELVQKMIFGHDIEAGFGPSPEAAADLTDEQAALPDPSTTSIAANLDGEQASRLLRLEAAVLSVAEQQRHAAKDQKMMEASLKAQLAGLETHLEAVMGVIHRTDTETHLIHHKPRPDERAAVVTALKTTCKDPPKLE